MILVVLLDLYDGPDRKRSKQELTREKERENEHKHILRKKKGLD